MRDILIDYSLSKGQILSLYCSILPNKGGQGLNAAANYYLSKKPSQFNIDEIVYVLAVARAPREKPEKNNKEKEGMLQEYYNSFK